MKSVELAEISASLRDYLDEYEQERERFKWIEKPYQVDRDQVVVVAFVQDEATKDVLQAAFAYPNERHKDRQNP